MQMETTQSYEEYHAARCEYMLEHGQEGDMQNLRIFLRELADEFFGGTEACSRLSLLDVACGYMREAPILSELFAKTGLCD